MPRIDGRLRGSLSFTPDGRVNLPGGRSPTMQLAVSTLGLADPEEKAQAEVLKERFRHVLPSFTPYDVSKIKPVERQAEIAEDNLRMLGFLKPVARIKTHPLRNSLAHVYNRSKIEYKEYLTEARLVSVWMQFLQRLVENRQDLSALSSLMMSQLIQETYLNQAHRLISQQVLSDHYEDLQRVQKILNEISRLLLNPRIVYSQPYMEAAQQSQVAISQIDDPGSPFYNELYSASIQRAIYSSQAEIIKALG